MLPSKVTQADNMLVSPADDAHDEVPRARIDKIDKTEVTLNGNISATGVASPPTTLPNCRLKHAQTEAHFEGSLLTEDGLLVKKTTQEDLERGQRFDSHNMLRSDEAADLVHLPGEQQIWLKRGDQSHKQTASAVTVASDHHPTLDAIDSSIPDLPTHITDAEMLLPLVEHPPVHTHTYAKPVISASKSEHRDILHSTGRNRENNNAVLATPVEEYDAYSIRSSVKSRSTAKKSHKSLTRRLSSFLTRSFRRKRHSPSVAGERNEKRISFVSATTSERPESSATRCSSEDPDDFAVLRSQQLLRLGFFLNIDEALRNEPDSFLFVPLTDSGYFSSNFDDIEKFPQLSSQEETFHTGDDLPSPTSTFNTIPPSPPSPPQPPKRNHTKLHTSISAAPPRRPIPHSTSSEPTHRHTQVQPSHVYRTVETPDGDPGRIRVHGDRETPGGPRRLSFIEGTSVMESINHLAYPSRELCEDRYFYGGLDGGENGGVETRRAREKLRFKRHPWKWIKSKF